MSTNIASLSPMGQAALALARRGWPVFPCNEKNGRPLVRADQDEAGKDIPNTGGLQKATCDEAQIVAWWTKWPRAQIGLHSGAGGLLHIDFDPRVDEIVDDETGEVVSDEWTVERLKAALLAQMGVPLPPTLASLTPSGGEHHWFRMPEGEPIGNSGTLPRHIDVRGQGGYVIAPPSVRLGDLGQGGKKGPGAYTWLHGDWTDPAAVLPAPPELVRILRAGKTPAAKRDRSASRPAPMAHGDADEAQRRYAMRALDEELRELESTPIGGGRWGGRNFGIYHAALKLGGFVLAGALRESVVRSSLEEVVRAMPANDDLPGALKAIDNGLANASARDLGAVGAQTTRGRGSGRSTSSSLPRRDGAAGPTPPSRAAADPPAASARAPDDQSSQAGRVDHVGTLKEAERVRLTKVAAAWLGRRLLHGEREAGAIRRLAFSIGRRAAAGLVDLDDAKRRLWEAYDGVADLQHADVDRALDDGAQRGFDLAPMLLAMKCAGYPLTPFGIAERLRDRYGHDYRFTTAKGWLGWDGRRWKVLDQDEKVPPAEVIAAVFDTIRAIQDEGRLIADTGVQWQLIEVRGPRGGVHEEIDLEDESNPHGLDRWIPKGKGFVLFSDAVKAFGRASETTGMPASVATLARRWLTVPIERFDLDPLAIGVMNGTLRFARVQTADGKRGSTVELCAHRREDLNTKLAPILYDPDAAAPLYDAMLEWAQPDATMRRYLHQVGGYAATGSTAEHKLWFWYGRGRNGKSTTIDAWCHALGDYSGTTLIETFLDQGIKKRGDQASPDLARLGGVRMLRASEPERGAKLNSALIKFVTGGEPVPTRALHRGFFDLLPQFKLIIGGNTKPDIPDTDEGIWSRMKLVSWLKNIDLEFNADGTPKKDPELLNKIKAGEAAGVFNRLVEGLLDYLADGLVEPAAVTADTQAYRDASDPLARFLRECTEADEDSTVQSSVLHGVFVAWCKAAGEREWTNKGFSNALTEKGWKKHKSSGMRWLGLRLTRSAGDFVDDNGNVRELDEASLASPPGRGPPGAPSPSAWDDDDMPL